MDKDDDDFDKEIADLKRIVKNLKIKDKSKINAAPMVEAAKFFNKHNIEYLLSDTEDDTPTNSTRGESSTNSETESTTSPNLGLMGPQGDTQNEYKELQLRREQCNELKVQANQAISDKDYEKALDIYHEAIYLIPDSALMYTNRAMTYMHLKDYENAIEDCETAIVFEEKYLMAWLYMAKCHFMLGNERKSEECIKNAHENNPNSTSKIKKYEEEFKTNPTAL